MTPSRDSADWRARVRSLRDGLRGEVEAVAGLRAVAARRTTIDELLADLDRQLERIERAAVVTLVGATGAGKSALLNAIVGRAVAQEGMDRPTTRVPVLYAPRDADLQELLAACTAATDGGDTPTVVRYDPGRGAAAAYVLVDSPDVNSIAEEHRAVVRALANHSDILLAVLHRQSVIEEASVSFLDEFAGRRGLVLVLNRCDELTTEAQEALVAQVGSLAAVRWNAADAPVLCVSAREAQTDPEREEWVRLRQTLERCVEETSLGGVRRQNALGIVLRLQEEFEDVAREAGEDLRELPTEAASGLGELVERVARETEVLWELRRVDLNHLLWSEAAKRWDGPGGWALRAGGAGSLGLGAAALLARRHPLLAAGAAIGGSAAQQVQRAAEQRRLSDADGLVPGAGDFAAAYSATLSPARIRAARLAGDPESMGVPALEKAYAAASAAVGDAWQSLVDRDLPAAGERSIARVFRLLLDLPLYALAAWVVFEVGRGFLRSDYVGVNFLVSALVLGGAYLLALGILVRRLLGFRARRLLRAARTRSTHALQLWREGAMQSLDRISAGMTAHLEQLRRVGESWAGQLGGGSTSESTDV